MPAETAPPILVESQAPPKDEIDPERATAVARLLAGELGKTLNQHYDFSDGYNSSELQSLSSNELFELQKKLSVFFTRAQEVLGAQDSRQSTRTAVKISQMGIQGAIAKIYFDRVKADPNSTKEGIIYAKNVMMSFAVASNHMYRQLGVGAYEGAQAFGRRELRNLLASVHPKGQEFEARSIELGISSEIAAAKALSEIVDEEEDGSIIRFSFGEEEKYGGDIVYQCDGQQYFIDIKTRTKGRSDDYTPSFYIDPDGVMPATKAGEPFEAKAKFFITDPEKIDDNYNVSDPAFKAELAKLLHALEDKD